MFDIPPFSQCGAPGPVRAPCLVGLCLRPAAGFTCYLSVPSATVLFASCSQFYKWNYTFEPAAFGLVIGPVHSLQFGSDLWKVWWTWHHLWGSVDCLKTPERNLQDLRHSIFCGLPEKATLSWHEREGSFSNYSSHVVTRSWSLVQNHEHWRGNLRWSWKKQLLSAGWGLWFRKTIFPPLKYKSMEEFL